MSDLDRELTQAVLNSQQNESAESASEAGGEEPAVFTGGESFEAPSPKRNLGLLVGLLIAAGGILALVFTSVDDAAIYSVTTDKLVDHPEQFEEKNVRVEGDLVSGSLKHRKEPCEYRFTIEKNGRQLPVRYPECIVPDTFKDVPGVEVQVTAEGTLSAEGHFEATHIMAKCPSKYEMQQRAKNGEVAPHAPMGDITTSEQE